MLSTAAAQSTGSKLIIGSSRHDEEKAYLDTPRAVCRSCRPAWTISSFWSSMMGALMAQLGQHDLWMHSTWSGCSRTRGRQMSLFSD
jgi:hypothetical protein